MSMAKYHLSISDARSMNMIEAAINEYHARTCIRFKARTYERDYVSFTSDQTGCWSSVGRLGGRQVSALYYHHTLNGIFHPSNMIAGH